MFAPVESICLSGKNDEFCIKNEELCIKNKKSFLLKNDNHLPCQAATKVFVIL